MDIFDKIYANYMSNIPEKELYIISDLLLIWATLFELEDVADRDSQQK